MTEFEDRYNAMAATYGHDVAREDAETIIELGNMALRHSVQTGAAQGGLDVAEVEAFLGLVEGGDIVTHALGAYAGARDAFRKQAEREARPKSLDDATDLMMEGLRAGRR